MFHHFQEVDGTYIVVNPMLAKGFGEGMLQAVIKSDGGAVFILQSYATTDSSGGPLFPGATITPHTEDPFCNYLLVATTGKLGQNVIPSGWTLQCGTLAKT